MKKAIALLATLVVLTSTTFAQLAPSISGSAETKLGFDLDNEANGFELSTDVTVTIPVTSGETVATADAEGAKGVATISGAELSISLNDLDLSAGDDENQAADVAGFSGAVGSIEAQIDFGNGFYMTIGSESDISANKVESLDGDYDVAPSFSDEDGVSIGYTKDAIAVELTVANEYAGYENDGDFEEGEDTVEAVTGTDVIKEVEAAGSEDSGADSWTKEDGYIYGLTASYTAEMFGLSLALGLDTNEADYEVGGETQTDNVKKTGVAVELTTTPIDGLTVAVPFDLYSAEGTSYEALVDVDYTGVENLTLGVDFQTISIDKTVSLDGEAYSANHLNANLEYALAADALTVTVPVVAKDLTGDIALEIDPTIAYAAGDITATVALDLDYADEFTFGAIGADATYGGIENVAISLETTIDTQEDATLFTLDSLKVEYSAIANTAVTAEYSGFNTDDAKGTFYVGAKISL